MKREKRDCPNSGFAGWHPVPVLRGAAQAGIMGVYPSLVLDYFGPKHYSTNYAFVFLAYGIGGLSPELLLPGAIPWRSWSSDARA